jgi:hypothetical protein
MSRSPAWAADDILLATAYQGVREDKKAREVRLERPS